MKKTASFVFAALGFCTAILGAADAQSAPGTALLDRLDTNGDGALTRDEIAAARERLFERLDFNRDGNLDAEEVGRFQDAVMDRAVALQILLGAQWRRMDSDADGTVSREEFRSRASFFDLIDRDGDGRLSSAEFILVRNILSGRPGR